MIKKSDKLICAYITLAGERYDASFELKKLVFTESQLVDRANELFPHDRKTVERLDLKNATHGMGGAANEKYFVRGSDDSLADYYRLAVREEVPSYDLDRIINKIQSNAFYYVPEIYKNDGEQGVLKFAHDYTQYIHALRWPRQVSDETIPTREAVWIAAAALTYNQYIISSSVNVEDYVFAQSSIARLAQIYNPRGSQATYSQVTGQSTTHGSNNQGYSYLMPHGDKRRISASHEAEQTKPEQLHLDFEVNTVDGIHSVEFLEEFINNQFSSFVKTGGWILMKKDPAIDDPVLKKIRFVLESYKRNFGAVDKQERYKWEAIGWYKEHWNIEAEGFAEMLETAFKKAYNLLASGMYYPYKMMVQFAKEQPEVVRSLFRSLHDETRPLAQRYIEFRAGFEAWISQLKKNDPEREKALQHYQDLRAVMVYLTFEYPEKYYLFKSTMFGTFASRVGFAEDKPKQATVIWKVESYTRMCDIILGEVRNDDELLSMHASRLSDDCYKDEALHLLTMDIVFYGSNYMTEDDFKEAEPAFAKPGYWPTLDEYDPGLDKEDWKKYILEIELPDHPRPMMMLKALIELGGEGSCKKLSEVYGGTPSRYVGCTMNLGRRIKKFFSLPPCMDDGKERLFAIPFLGREVIEDGSRNYSYLIRPELYEALKEIDLSMIDPYCIDEDDMFDSKTDIGLNTILYGPPGTGKTYHSVIYAVAIIEDRELASVEAEDYAEVLERYKEYKEQGRIEFTTFHQSYGYEEFIEGIKPVINDDDNESGSTGDIRYSVQPGVFKRFCEKAERPTAATVDYGIGDSPTIWKVSLEGTGDNPTRTECMKNGHIRIGWDDYGKDITDETDFSASGGRVVLNAFINRMQIGDIVLSCYSAATIDAIGVVTGEYEWHDEYAHYKRLRKVHWIVQGIQENILAINGGTSMTLASVYRMSNVALADVYQIINKHQPAPVAAVMKQRENYVFIIDEINRGNISKIFGELITLIEDTKRVGRPEGTKAILPYSQKAFGVPGNVYIIGTMNTADRSIATIDTALRRRFLFREMMPNPDVLADVKVEDLSISAMLDRMNRRIAVLYDREHTIGHAYFVALKDNPTIEALAEIFTNNIIPLLQEYFYEDYEKIRLVLGDNNKTDPDEQFIVAKTNDYGDLFGNADVGLDDGFTYEINKKAFETIEAYRSI